MKQQHIEAFIKALHLPKHITEALNSEEDFDAKTVAEEYQKDRETFFIEKNREAIEQEGGDKMKAIAMRQFKKDLKKFFDLDMSNKDLNEVKVEDVLSLVKNTHSQKLQSLVEGEKAGMIEELNKFTSLASERQRRIEELEEQTEELGKQYESKIKQKESEWKKLAYVDNMFDKMEGIARDAPGFAENFKTVKSKLLSYSIDDGGKILKTDGGKIIHPGKQINIETAEEMAEYLLDIHGLKQQSNAGQTRKQFETHQGKQMLTGDLPPNVIAAAERRRKAAESGRAPG